MVQHYVSALSPLASSKNLPVSADKPGDPVSRRCTSSKLGDIFLVN
jgi:hypothetical protein